jgi:hypothetical protein
MYAMSRSFGSSLLGTYGQAERQMDFTGMSICLKRNYLSGRYICPSVHPEQAKARLLALYLHWYNLSALLEHLQKVSLDQTVLHLQNVAVASVLVIRLTCLLMSVALDRTEWASSMREGM